MAGRKQQPRICDRCQATVDAYVEVAAEWDRDMSLLANLLVQIVMPNDGLTPDDSSQLGGILKDYLRRFNIMRHYFFDVELDVFDKALVAGTLEFLKRRSRTHFHGRGSGDGPEGDDNRSED